MTKLYKRTDAFDGEEFEDDLVVMNKRTQAMVTLNAPAAVVWDALDEGASLDDLVAILAEAFPEAAAADIRCDIATILRWLEDAELVTATDVDGSAE